MKTFLWLLLFVPLVACGENTSTLQNESAELQELREKAETSDKLAQYALGILYLQGDGGVVQSNAQASKWMKLAAGQSFADAQHLLGTLYEEGRGVRQDYKKAAAWYKKAASQNNAAGAFRLATLYEGEKLGAPNYNEAKAWYNRALGAGNAAAAYRLGIMHLKGKGVQQSNVLAFIWFDLATRLGFKGVEDQRAALKANMTIDEVENANGQSDNLYNQLKDRVGQ